jgi:hypothetical protein
VGDGADFVEIYNRSGKIINLDKLKLGVADFDLFGNADTVYKQVSDDDRLLLPGDFMVLSPDPQIVQYQYYCENPGSFIGMKVFPQLKNESGNVIIGYDDGRIIDYMQYDEDMHHPLLKIVDGVSLERIHYSAPSLDGNSWHSSSSAVGYATPGYQNSQFRIFDTPADQFEVQPEVFSPDNDGYEDIVQFVYSFSDPGRMASLLIYDFSGRPVRVIANNVMLGTEGSFNWNGTSDSGQTVSMGVYIVYLETFDIRGGKSRFKRTVVVAGERKTGF